MNEDENDVSNDIANDIAKNIAKTNEKCIRINSGCLNQCIRQQDNRILSATPSNCSKENLDYLGLINIDTSEDNEDSGDTVTMDNGQSIFTEREIKTEMEDILNELEKAKESPSFRIDIMVGREDIDSDRIKNEIAKKIEKRITCMAEEFAYIKESIRNDYYCIKEFMNPLCLNIIRRDISTRYAYFTKKTLEDFDKIRQCVNTIRHFAFVDISEYNSYIRTHSIIVRVHCDILADFSMDNIEQKMTYVARIIKDSSNSVLHAKDFN